MVYPDPTRDTLELVLIGISSDELILLYRLSICLILSGLFESILFDRYRLLECPYLFECIS